MVFQKRVGIILQARMGSTRLPGKVLKPLAGKPMIQWIIERLRMCCKVDSLILATSFMDRDTPLVCMAVELGIDTFRGSEFDVLDRYYQCSLVHRLDIIIRATGDNPFVDPDLCGSLIDFFLRNDLDYAWVSTDPPDGCPLGVGLEIFSFEALKKSWEEGQGPHHREHVNEYVLENPLIFKQASMSAPSKIRAPELSLTVDTFEEFVSAEKIYSYCLSRHPGHPVSAIRAIEYLKTHGMK